MTSRSVMVRIRGDVSDLNRALLSGGRNLHQFSDRLETSNDRATWLAQGLTAIVPAIAPIGAQAVPALAGLTAQLGAAALAAGTTVVAFQGVGDAMKAYLAYEADPTAENLAAVTEAMSTLSPAARDLVVQIDGLLPQLRELRNATADAMLPGVSDGLDSLITTLPRVQALLTSVGRANGQLVADGGKSLAGADWREFFDYLQREAAPTTLDMGRTIGNLTHGIASLLVAFEPLERQWSTGWLNMSRSFNQWADGVDETQGFEDFLNYLETSGPQVLDTVGALAKAALEVGEAAAPLGGPTLAVIRGIANALAEIADSPFGSVLIAGAAGISAISRALAVKDLLVRKGGEAESTMIGRSVTGYQSQVKAVGSLPGAYRAASAAQRELNAAQATFTQERRRYNATLQVVNTTKAGGFTPTEAQNTRLADSLGRVEMANYGVTAATEKAKTAEVSRSRVLRESAAGLGKTAAGAAGLAFAMSGAADSTGLTNTATLALTGTMLGPWGAAIGGGVGAAMDLAHAGDAADEALTGLNRAARLDNLDAMQKSLHGVTKELNDLSNTSSVGDFFGDLAKRGASDIQDLLSGNVTSWTQMGAGQQKQLQDALHMTAQVQLAFDDLGSAMGVFRDGVAYSTSDTLKFASQVAPALLQVGISAKDLANMSPGELEKLAPTLQQIMAASDSTAGRTKALGDSLGGLDDKMLSTADSASTFATAINALLGPNLSAEAATDTYTTSLRELGKALKDNKGGFEGNGKAALANRDASRQWMSGFTDMLTKQAEAGASSAKIARDVDGARAAFMREGIAAGLSAGEIRKRLRVMGLTPKLIRTVFNAAGLEVVSTKVARLNRQYQGLPRNVRVAIKADGVPKTTGDLDKLDRKVGGLTKQQRRIVARLMDQTKPVQDKILRNLKKLDKAKTKPKVDVDDRATPKLHGIQAYINNMHGKELVITTRHDTKSAAGNLFYASGGMWGSSPDRANGHLPHFARGGTYRTFAEDETGGEAYIPLANDWRRPRAQAIASETVRMLGGSARFASGGFGPYAGDYMRARSFAAGGTYATGPGVTVTFPAPTVYAAAVAAADKIAASGAKYTASAQELRQVRLDDLHLQQQIAQTRKSLAEHEDKIVGKGKHKKTLKGKGGYSLTGIDRTVAQAELNDLQAQLTAGRKLSAVAQAAADAAQQALETQREARTTSTTALTGLGDIFGRGTSATGAVASVNKQIANIAAYGEVVAKLKAAGASPALLAQVVSKGEGGDIASAVKLGRALLAQPQVLGQLNTSLATLGTVSASVANITTDPRFSGAGAWDPTSLAPKQQVAITIAADPSTWTAEISRKVEFAVTNALAGG